MAWSRTLGDLVTDVTDRADVSGFIARHPVATVRRRIIESYRAMRGWMIDAGSNRWLSPVPVELDPTQATASDYGVHFHLVTAGGTPVSYCKTQKVEALIAGKWRELTCGVLGEVYQYAAGNSGEPQMWIPTGFSAEPTSAANAIESIFIVPMTSATAYRVRVWASPLVNVTDADATALVLDGPGFDWIIWDCVIKIAARDNDSQSTYAIAVNERKAAEDAIRRNIATEVRATGQRRDVFAAPNQRRRTW